MLLDPNKNLQTEKDSLQKNQLMEAARIVFQQHGFAKASIDDIAKQAAKSRTTLYKYYKNKDQIFEDFIVLQIAEIIDLAAGAIGTASSLELKLLNYNTKKLEILRLKFADYNLVVNEVIDGVNHCLFFQNQFSLAEKVIMKNIFQESLDQQEIKPITSAELDFLISVITLALRGIEQEAFSTAQDIHLEERLKWLIGILVQGLK